jgi:hypothetical protein
MAAACERTDYCARRAVVALYGKCSDGASERPFSAEADFGGLREISAATPLVFGADPWSGGSSRHARQVRARGAHPGDGSSIGKRSAVTRSDCGAFRLSYRRTQMGLLALPSASIAALCCHSASTVTAGNGFNKQSLPSVRAWQASVFDSSGGGTRTPDTRIMIPLL